MQRAGGSRRKIYGKRLLSVEQAPPVLNQEEEIREDPRKSVAGFL
jgi:hypothetical protein